MRVRIALLTIMSVVGLRAHSSGDDALQIQEVQIKRSADEISQPAIWFAPESAKSKPVPLLVILHTWGGDYQQAKYVDECLPACSEHGWALIHPNFRGPNNNANACASKLAIADVLDAVQYAKDNAKIDATRIYLVGTSGGGHMALVMAHSAPEVWAGVSSWVPVVDLAAWHGETKAAQLNYWKNVEAICGGPPGTSEKVDAQYRARSPLFHLAKAKDVPIDLNVGIHDGHAGSIPVSHSLLAFNALADANGAADMQLTDEQIEFMRTQQSIPKELSGERVNDPDRRRKILFRRAADPVRLTVFDGGHEGDMPAAIKWLAQQHRK